MEKRVACYEYIPNDPHAEVAELQSGALNLYCKQNGISNVESFVDRDGDGVKFSRLALIKMMAAVENNEISSVIAPSLSRLAKSSKHLLIVLQTLDRKGVRFISINDKIDTAIAKQFNFLSILSSIVQFENDLSSGRTKTGLHQARLEGKLLGRKKKRDSELIRKLLKAGMTIRQTAVISKASQGSVYQEKLAMKRDEKIERKKQFETQSEFVS